MPLADLLRHVEDAGRGEAERILGDARRQAAEIVRRAQARAAARLETALDAERRLRRREAERRLAEARRDRRGGTLRARRTLLHQIFAEAHRRLAAHDAELRPSPEAAGRAPSTPPPEVSACLPPGRGVVLVQDASGGARWATDDGAVQIDLSAASRLEDLRPELEVALLHEMEVG